MYKLKLTKGLSYLGIVRASKRSPYVTVENAGDAESLVMSGHFELVSATDAEARITPEASEAELREKEAEDNNPPADYSEAAAGETEDADATEEPLNLDTGDAAIIAEEYGLDVLLTMSKAELVSLASDKGIDISTCRNNERRAEAIYAALTA